ncbi:DNA polymerase II large subunit [Candidatus Woesearchaeota archaeon]|nr:DNA polymerase II large subunit [Candidatus Woesearchaeota archaeon]
MINEYFDEIERNVKSCYELANKARILGYDPEVKAEIILARNMVERVEGIISTVAPQIKNSGMTDRILELENEYNKLDWRVALKIALEVAQEKFCKFKDKKEAMEVGIRVALAYLTSGVVSSPLEGFVELKIKQRNDGKEYFCLMFSGPIRSAGTTIICGTLLSADYVRKNMGYEPYDPTEEEVKRMITELYDYHERATNLQYLPSEQEIEFLVRNLSLQISGDPSEKIEVSNYKNLPRIETNFIRNGPCLVLGEGLAQKAPKMWKNMFKWKDEFGLKHWDYINDFITLQKKIRSKGKEVKKDDTRKVSPDYNYIKDLVAGRPILTHPLRVGGFRLRYGRSRISGLSSMAIHPATMILLDDYIATGTQLRYERPGKSSAMEPCDTIEGPIVKLKNGNVIFVNTEEEARLYKNQVEEILFLGDFLVNYGEFFNRGHRLVPCGYNEEWYLQELKQLNPEDELIEKLKQDRFYKITAKQSFELSKKYNVSLHPRYTYHWNDIDIEQFKSFINWYKEGSLNEEKILLPFVYDLTSEIKDRDPKRVLELLGIPHRVIEREYVAIEDDDAYTLYHLINLNNLDNISNNTLENINKISGINIRDKSGTFIGARMGRPEKAKLRKLTGNPHMLFPVGEQGGRMRNLQTALTKGKVTAEFSNYFCKKCNKQTIYPKCEICGEKLEFKGFGKINVDVDYYFKYALKKVGLTEYPGIIKGVRGTSNKEHIPENMVKGILRSKYNLNVNKDGTIRYDMTEMPITHFKPKEIFTTIEKLKELGYEKDIYGNEISNEEQLLEIKPQDIILPACEVSNEEGADKVLTRVANYIDDLLVQLYGLDKFYKITTREDLIGHLVIGLAPHISASIIGRIIGFSKTQGCFAHPLWHSAQRRDCEGDENCVMLLMDSLLNFSRHYLPNSRGATQDTPLVLTSILTPSEVDDMIFDMDLVWEYPLKLYEAAQQYKDPWEIEIEQLRKRLGKEGQFENWGFTHNISNLNIGVLCSAYKNIPSMMDKVLGQMEIANKIRAVDEADVARLTIERHFIRDIKGNLRKFSSQQFRCVDCNEKFRRPPLVGKCPNCNGKILFTISEGSIIKYLEPSMQLAERYNVSTYLKQSLELTKRRIEGVFGKDDDKQEGLNKWF